MMRCVFSGRQSPQIREAILCRDCALELASERDTFGAYPRVACLACHLTAQMNAEQFNDLMYRALADPPRLNVFFGFNMCNDWQPVFEEDASELELYFAQCIVRNELPFGRQYLTSSAGDFVWRNPFEVGETYYFAHEKNSRYKAVIIGAPRTNWHIITPPSFAQKGLFQ